MNKKYTNYNDIDFAEEPSFIRWVQGKDQKAIAFWNQWMSKHPEKSADINAAKTLVKSIKIKETEPSETQIKNLWNKIDQATPEEKTTATVRPIGRRRWMGYAAAACIGLLAFFYFYNPSTTVNANLGEQLAYTLPDNSKIAINAGSSISFKNRGFSGERIVNLEGEAFFEVTKGNKFKVVTPNGTIEVLGTRFNVNTRNGNLIVDCEEGKVRVTAKSDAQILTAGLGTRLNENKTGLAKAYTSDISKQLGWRKGEFFLANVTLSQAIAELERQFNVQVAIEQGLQNKLGDYSFNKGQQTNKDLEKALNDMLYQINGTFEINGNKIKITTK